MARSVAELLADGLHSISLNILVFGPQTATPSSDARTQKLQKKRVEIKEHLEKLGHTAKFAEELVDPALPESFLVQEHVIMHEYDLIVTLVESPGSIVETTLIATHPRLANKAALFMDKDFTHGLPADTCRSAAMIGAFYQEYQYPDDLEKCHLLGFVDDRVSKMRLIKFLM